MGAKVPSALALGPGGCYSPLWVDLTPGTLISGKGPLTLTPPIVLEDRGDRAGSKVRCALAQG